MSNSIMVLLFEVASEEEALLVYDRLILEQIQAETFDLERESEKSEAPVVLEDPLLYFDDFNFVDGKLCDICLDEKKWIFRSKVCHCVMNICDYCVKRIDKCPFCRTKFD